MPRSWLPIPPPPERCQGFLEGWLTVGLGQSPVRAGTKTHGNMSTGHRDQPEQPSQTPSTPSSHSTKAPLPAGHRGAGSPVTQGESRAGAQTWLPCPSQLTTGPEDPVLLAPQALQAQRRPLCGRGPRGWTHLGAACGFLLENPWRTPAASSLFSLLPPLHPTRACQSDNILRGFLSILKCATV